MKLNDAAADLLDKIRQTAPLVHNITNFVVMNSSANMVLAVGASPVMAHSRHEAEEMTALASALVLNIGTLDEAWIDAMLLAARVANDHGIPVILDPVGAGATGYRSRSVQRILGEVAVTVIRGNGSEVFSLADTRVKTKGVDSSLSLSDDIVDAAGTIARQHGCIVAISGEKDLLTDGDRVMRVANGVPLMTRVTGMGCGLSAVTAAFCAVGGDDLLAASTAAFAIYGLCGQLAHQISDQPGSFSVAFVDALYTAGRDDIRDLLKVESYRKPPGR